ncbi:MAG: hypothetical protein LBR95_01925 [Azoarcus sp.]|jgi:hypothetical protein|nr:hypothetical protein [Azoarcus sp.]
MKQNSDEYIMQSVAASLPKRTVSDGLAFGKEAQEALDAWIAAGAVPGDEHLYGLMVEDADGE